MAEHAHQLRRRRAPAAKSGLQAYQSKSFAPRSGLPQQWSVRTKPVGGAPPRRMEAAGIPNQKLCPRVGSPTTVERAHQPRRRRTLAAKSRLQAYQINSFAPRSGLPQQWSVRTNPVGGAPPRRTQVNDCSDLSIPSPYKVGPARQSRSGCSNSEQHATNDRNPNDLAA